MEGQLTPKQERFCLEYLIDLNGTQAAIRAGYAESGANVEGHRLLTNANVAERIVSLQKERADRTQITADRVLTELAKIGFSNMSDFATWGAGGVLMLDSEGLTQEQLAAVQEINESTGKTNTLKIKLHDKLGALSKLGDHLGLFKTKVELTGKDGGPVEFGTPEERLAKTLELIDRARARGGPEASDSNAGGESSSLG